MTHDLHDGSPWIDVNFMDSLKNLSPEDAIKKPYDLNSIWQLLVHIISWRKLNMQRLQGSQVNTPDHNFILPVTDTSETAWQNLLNEFRNSNQEWLNYLSSINDAELERINETNGMSYYKQIHGILQHDCYHLGQIVMLSRLVKRIEA